MWVVVCHRKVIQVAGYEAGLMVRS
jgi:hypothetical protein